ncbi:MAG TPA: ExsB family transcriptional regulator, partial [Blastococcus sp.]|nr:ExsB family transcriptional regulator [Blastococcus sp.]
MSTLDDRLAALDAQFAPLPGVLVAFSGGVDSGVVLAAAVRGLGPDRVVAATAVSPSLPAAERAGAAAFGASLGVRHEFPRTDELSRAGYVANGGDRCAFCKTELVDVLTPLAARLGIADVVTGTNADDLTAGFRPGIAAAAARGAWAPLARAGMTKDDVRAAARRWELPLADKPAAACLASRIAYGVP